MLSVAFFIVMLSVVMLSVVMLSVVMLSVVILHVVAPTNALANFAALIADVKGVVLQDPGEGGNMEDVGVEFSTVS
jgi:hypothetical protein